MRYILIGIYTLLYLSHIYYGPYFYRFLMKNKEMKYKSKNLKEILNKSIFITYVSMLYTIYFFYKPNAESFINALLMTVLALIFYIIKYNNKRSEHFCDSIIDHSLLILPFIFYKNSFNIVLKTYNFRNQSFFTIILLFIYTANHKKIYK